MELFGRAIYNGRPFLRYADKREFLLRDVYDPSVAYLFKFRPRRYVEVELGAGEGNSVTIDRLPGRIKSVSWMDNGELLQFEQHGDKADITLTPMPYGYSYPVRVAELHMEQ